MRPQTIGLFAAIAALGSLAIDAPPGGAVDYHMTSTNTAASALNALPTKGRAPKTGYSREQFGPAWADTDRNGCDTRNDILNRDLQQRQWRPSTNSCVVIAGSLQDPYTGKTLIFDKARATAVQIDHVVALSDAWQKGAQALSPTGRQAFANDPINLLAVDGPTNLRKGDGDAATWLPPNRGYRCRYIARQVTVKAKYKLWVTAAERAAMQQVLVACPAEPMTAGATPVVTVPTPIPTTSGAVPVYANCDAARLAGVAPLHRGQPGYQSKLDRDNDGIACE